jgi:serine/threonine protein kinase
MLDFRYSKGEAQVGDPNSLVGQKGHYRITDPTPFAYGRISVLLSATDSVGSNLCVKMFRGSPRTRSGGSLSTEFAAELTAHRRLKHPHILAIIDYADGLPSRDPRPFLVLPFCAGGNLRSLMNAKDFLPPGEARGVLEQIATAIDYAHANGVIHGDIKPENILFSGDQSHAYLSDFGMAKYFAITEDISTRTSGAGAGAGSTAYLSPEQIDEAKQSPRSDIYSFAVVAYEVLTGSLPFDVREGTFRQMKAKVAGNLIPPTKANPLLPESMSATLLRGLSVDRGSRPASASEFCNELFGTPKSTVRTSSYGRRGPRNFWSSLRTDYKVALITAVVAAVAGIVKAAVSIIPELLKH